jgi:Alginate lyase
VARHRSPGTRNAPPARPSHEQLSEQGDGTRGARTAPTPAHSAVLVAVAIAAVIAVIGSMLSFAGALGPPSEAGVDLASGDLAAPPPAPAEPTPGPLDLEPEPSTTAPTTEATAEENAGKEDADEEAREGTLPQVVARAVRFPAEIIDASKWYLTLPTGAEGDPDTVSTKDLATYASEYFRLNDSKDGVVFTANAGGATTENSKYPRSELREMIGGENASWDGRSGTHTMELDQAITKTPSTKPDVIAGQIHGGNDDVMQIHLSGKKLTVKYADGDKEVVLDPSYRLGERFRVKIQSADGQVKVWHNGTLKADLPIYGAESYFKAGAYVNSNTDKGASSSDVGQVVIYGLKISHT